MNPRFVVFYVVGTVIVVWLVQTLMADETFEPPTPITPVGYVTPVGGS